MFEALKAAFTVLRKGEELRHAETWKKAQLATGLLAAVLGGIVVILRAFGVDLPVSDLDLATIAAGIVAAVGVFDAYVTPATTRKVGLPASTDSTDPGDVGVSGDPGADKPSVPMWGDE